MTNPPAQISSPQSDCAASEGRQPDIVLAAESFPIEGTEVLHAVSRENESADHGTRPTRRRTCRGRTSKTKNAKRRAACGASTHQGRQRDAVDDGTPGGTLDPLLDVYQVAALLGVQPTTVYQWAYQRRIAKVKIGALLRFRQSTIRRLIDDGERPALKPA